MSEARPAPPPQQQSPTKKTKTAQPLDDDVSNPLIQLGSDKDTVEEENGDDKEKEEKEEEEEAPVAAEEKPTPKPTPAAKPTAKPTARPSFTFETLENGLPDDWKTALAGEFKKPYWAKLKEQLCHERDAAVEIFPAVNDIFEAFWATPLDEVRVFLCGQDPYHDNNQAVGLAFSIPKSMKKLPPSLGNIYKELLTDIPGFTKPTHGDLSSWSKQGIFMLNTVLTVRAHKANSHEKFGWLQFTDAVVQLLKTREKIVWILWGKPAQKKAGAVNAQKNCIIQSAHPSPLSARFGFFDSKPFSQTNAYLVKNGFKPITWQV